ncbi:MAG: aspartate dehydrogenase [Pseudomonadota bacterium]
MKRDWTVAIAGLGAIGQKVAHALDRGDIPRMALTAVSARDHDGARAKLAAYAAQPDVVHAGELAARADIVIDCAPAEVFAEIAEPAIERGCVLMPLSVGALLRHMELVDRARETGAQIIVPTGALIGLDTVRAMAVGEIHKVTLQTRKPPGGLAGAPHLVKNNIDVHALTEATRVFEGTAREAAMGFPANVNVAAALALAGVGPENTMVEVWADPEIKRNRQSVTIVSDSGEATMTINNIPSDENPKTGRIVANSVIATLARMTSPLVAGT